MFAQMFSGYLHELEPLPLLQGTPSLARYVKDWVWCSTADGEALLTISWRKT